MHLSIIMGAYTYGVYVYALTHYTYLLPIGYYY